MDLQQNIFKESSNSPNHHEMKDSWEFLEDLNLQ